VAVHIAHAADAGLRPEEAAEAHRAAQQAEATDRGLCPHGAAHGGGRPAAAAGLLLAICGISAH